MATDAEEKMAFHAKYFSRFNAEIVFEDGRNNEHEDYEQFDDIEYFLYHADE